MPASTRETPLCRYHYDPLDRLVDCTPFERTAIQRYYCKTRLATEIQGTEQRTIVQHDDQLLAQLQREDGKVTATLLATDQQRSVLNALDSSKPKALAYSPYGHRPRENGLLSLLGFNGEQPDPVTGHYHLGNGYRQFNPVLMRFNSPDSWSPFGKGGLNAYAYCSGDPINYVDPNGHTLTGIVATFTRRHSLTVEITSNVQGILNKRGMLYKGHRLGYQLGEESTLLKLDDLSIGTINLHTEKVETANANLIKLQNELLNNAPDSLAKREAVAYREIAIQYPTVLNVSNSKDKAVVNLHSQVMAFEHHSSALNMITEIPTTASPAANSAAIRQLK
ncbi:MAG TPA: Rhs family protein [Pseudomonas sp.]|jgi:RHS repeat-associated protein|nr:Rhs family protein [Pseudomonas sp.]